MRLRALRRDISRTWLAPCALLWLLDCGIARGPKPEVDSESHFLGCTSAAECSGIVGATCAGGWCVDVETGERIGMNALGDGNWDALPPGSSADGFPADGAWLGGVDPGLSSPQGSSPAGMDPAASQACSTVAFLDVPRYENQVELNRLSGCEDIYGDLEITFDADLRALSSLRNLFGTLYIHSPYGQPLSSLVGLENLELVAGDLRLANLGVSSLQSLAGLEGVGAEPGQGLVLEDSAGLRDLRGLVNLRNVENVSISGLPQLTSLNGLNFAGQQMESMALRDVPALAGDLPITADNITLENTGVTSFTGVQGSTLTLRNNAKLATVIAYQVDQLVIERNPKLVGFAVPTGMPAMGILQLVGNASLQSIVDVGELTSIGFLIVNDNPVLQTVSLPWLQSLTVVQVIRNPNLTSIDLPLLAQQVEDLKVVSNPSLDMPTIFSLTGRARKYKLAGNQGDPHFLDPCPYIRDTFCDEPPVDSICAPGTDRYDCGEPL